MSLYSQDILRSEVFFSQKAHTAEPIRTRKPLAINVYGFNARLNKGGSAPLPPPP